MKYSLDLLFLLDATQELEFCLKALGQALPLVDSILVSDYGETCEVKFGFVAYKGMVDETQG